jgi:hypothetical protein
MTTRDHAMALALNVALFQVGWFACVLGGAGGAPQVGLVAAAVAIGWHLARAARPAPEALLVCAALLLGLAFETALVQSGWVRFADGPLAPGIPPAWMVALWALCATTLNVSLRWLRARPGLAAVLGAAGGPIAYSGGEQLGALELSPAGPALAAIALGWALLLPALLALARRLDGQARA